MRRNRVVRNALEVRRKMQRQLVVLGMISLVLGILFVINPKMSVNIIITLSALVLLVIGVLQLFDFLRADEDEKFSGKQMGVALTVMAFGGYLLIQGTGLAHVIGLIAALLFMYHGGFHLQASVVQYRSNYEKWWLPLLFSLASIAGGVYALISQAGVDEVFMRVLGMAMLMLAAFDAYSLLIMSKVIPMEVMDSLSEEQSLMKRG